MYEHHIGVTKSDVKVYTNGKCVDICVKPEEKKGARSKVITVTLERATAVHLRDALEAYFKLDSTM